MIWARAIPVWWHNFLEGAGIGMTPHPSAKGGCEALVHVAGELGERPRFVHATRGKYERRGAMRARRKALKLRGILAVDGGRGLWAYKGASRHWADTGLGVDQMHIPHRVRSVARQAFRHAMFTGKTQLTVGKFHASCDIDDIRVEHGENVWRVPIAASWL